MADVVLIPNPTQWASCRAPMASHQVSFWDRMLIASCLEGGVRTLFTEDLPGGSTIPGLKIVNPFAKLANS